MIHWLLNYYGYYIINLYQNFSIKMNVLLNTQQGHDSLNLSFDSKIFKLNILYCFQETTPLPKEMCFLFVKV